VKVILLANSSELDHLVMSLQTHLSPNSFPYCVFTAKCK